MKRLTQSACLILAGIMFGWWLHGSTNTQIKMQPPASSPDKQVIAPPANGLTQGEIYRVASISMGDARVDNLDIAVLDYEPPAGVDGLLGMNVLRNYRFEIDQDRELLYLRPRN